MAKISELPGGSEITGNETVPVVQGAEMRQIPLLQVLAAPQAADIIKVGERSVAQVLTAMPGEVAGNLADTVGVTWPDPVSGAASVAVDQIFFAIAPAGAISPADGDREVSGERRTYLKQSASTWVDLGDKAAQLTKASAISLPISAAQQSALNDKADKWALDVLSQTIGVTLKVGAGGEYPTINAALQAAKKYRPGFVNKGLSVAVELQAGFVVAEQIFVCQDDLSYITITSIDAIVPIRRSAINQNNGNASTNNWRTGTYPVFCAMRGGALPYIKALFDFDGSGGFTAAGNPSGAGTVGVYVFENARAVIGQGCGVMGAGWRGLYFDNGYVYHRKAIWRRSGLVGGPDTASFVAGHGYGVRGSNLGRGMGRTCDASGSYTGGYFSKATADCVDMLADDCVDIGIAATDHANVTISGAKARRCTNGLRVDQGASVFGGESSEVDGSFFDATGSHGYGLLALGGSKLTLINPTATSETTNALRADASNVHIIDGALWTTANRSAVLADLGSSVNLPGTKVEGAGTFDLEVKGGATVAVALTTCLDGTTPTRANVRGGEFSPLGILNGRDDRREYYSTNANVALYPTSAPEFVLTGALTGNRDLSLFLSTLAPSKRFKVVHAGSGSPLSVYADGLKTIRLAVLAPGESIEVAPDGNGGWIVIAIYKKPFSGRSWGLADLVLTFASRYIRPTGNITANYKATLPTLSATDYATSDFIFTRTDTGSGIWSIYAYDGALIATVAAGQFVHIAPKSDFTGWYVAERGLLN